MKIHRSALGLVLLVSLSVAKTIPTAEPISTATEKKTLDQEVPTKPEAPPKPETPEVPAEIAVESAQESKPADRAKKSATTTFCVEIRPGPSDAPVKVCDEHNNPPPPPSPPPPQSEPQTPNAPQDLHQEFHVDHEQLPLFVIPPNPLAVYIPNEPAVNCPPQFVHHHNQVQGIGQSIIIPSPSSVPCPSLPSPSQHIIIPSSGSYPSIASSSGQHLIVPSLSTSGASQHIVIPSTGSGLCPCQSTSANGLHPHALISLFRSAMARSDDNMSSAPMEPTMEMRSGGSDDWLDSGAGMLMGGGMEASNQMPYGSDGSSIDSPFARTNIKKMFALPIGSYYGSGGYQAKSPYVVQCNPQVLALGGGGVGASSLVFNSGRFRDAEGNPDIKNMGNGPQNVDQMLAMNEAQMNLGTPQGGRHVILPMVPSMIHTSPGASFHSSPSIYQHTSTQQAYQTRPIYSSHDSGYMIHPSSHFYRREGAPQQLRTPSNEQPAQNMQQSPSSDMEMQRRQQQFQGKSWTEQTGNMERASSDMSSMQQRENGQQSAAHMTPSQMLNKMKGLGSSSFGSPVMQSFPRELEESSPCKEGVHVNMHIPSGGQPFMIGAPRNRDDQNIATNHGGPMYEDMAKREAAKSPVSEIDA